MQLSLYGSSQRLCFVCLLGLREEMNRHKQDSVGKRWKLCFYCWVPWWKGKKNQPSGEVVGGWFCPPPPKKSFRSNFPIFPSVFGVVGKYAMLQALLARGGYHKGPGQVFWFFLVHGLAWGLVVGGPRHVNPPCIHRAFPWEEPLTNHQPANHESMPRRLLVIRYRRYKDYRSIHRLWSYDFIWAMKKP